MNTALSTGHGVDEAESFYQPRDPWEADAAGQIDELQLPDDFWEDPDLALLAQRLNQPTLTLLADRINGDPARNRRQVLQAVASAYEEYQTGHGTD